MKTSAVKYVIGIDEVGRAASKRRASPKYIIGIDEVGRGALAGPVVVAAACFPVNLKIINKKLGALKDSKKLSPKLRKLWVEHFKSVPAIYWETARIYPRKIEKINISQAANRAAGVAFAKLEESLALQKGKYEIFLDGGLFIRGRKNLPAKTIIRADEKITVVKVASIFAKVERDRYMEKLSKRHPRYGFEIHKGYGTRVHMAAIRRHGPSDVHRKTFIRFS